MISMCPSKNMASLMQLQGKLASTLRRKLNDCDIERQWRHEASEKGVALTSNLNYP